MAQYQNNLFCTFLVDEAGSIIAFADASGNIGFESAWSPYGRYMNYSYGPGSFSGSWFYYLGAHGIQNICGDLYCMNARHYHAGLKRFLTPDPIGLDGGFNLYLYANNNPVLYVDPSGYISYLMVTGFDETDIFTDAAIQRSVEIMTSDGFDFYRDEVVHVPAFSVGQISRALQNNEDIAELSYFGHGGPGVLYISGSQGEPFNLSVNGGPAGVASESTSISTMPTENVLPGAKINLYSCSSAVSKGGTPSIAQGFADHFNTTVKGSGAGVGFDSKGPYIQPWRAAVGKAKNILPGHSGGGAWKDVKPTQAPKIQK
jgi:RHS repeat-associated protein